MKLTTNLWWRYALVFVNGIAIMTKGVFGRTNPLEIEGFKFFDSVTGDSVAIKGIDYYPRPNAGALNVNNFDFFHDEYRHVWERDIAFFEELGINAIRIYAVDPGKNHDNFMCALQRAGIYVMVGIGANCLNCAITRDAAPTCYPKELKRRGQMIISVFARYENVLGFSVGNEVGLNAPYPEINAPCQKKFLRDMRRYIQDCPLMRKIPVGLAIADIERVDKANYYNCHTGDELERTEFLGLNAYQYCNHNSQDVAFAAGFQNMRTDFGNYPAPLLLTEYGCLNPTFPTIGNFAGQRTFLQSQWMYEGDFQDVFAGGFVFEYSTERVNVAVPYPYNLFAPGNFGIGYFSGETCTDSAADPEEWCVYNPKPEFYNLMNAYAATETVGVAKRGDFVVDPMRSGASTCPSSYAAVTDFDWPSEDISDLPCTWYTRLTCPNVPSSAPTTIPPSPQPTKNPTFSPTTSPPSPQPTKNPTFSPTEQPTPEPTGAPVTAAPTSSSAPSTETRYPTTRPTFDPTFVPTFVPTSVPTALPTLVPTVSPSSSPLSSSSTTPKPTMVSNNNATQPGLSAAVTVGGGTTSIRLDDFRVSTSGIDNNDENLRTKLEFYLHEVYRAMYPGFASVRVGIADGSEETASSSSSARVVVFFGVARFHGETPRSLEVIEAQEIALTDLDRVETVIFSNQGLIGQNIVFESIELLRSIPNTEPANALSSGSLRPHSSWILLVATVMVAVWIR